MTFHILIVAIKLLEQTMSLIELCVQEEQADNPCDYVSYDDNNNDDDRKFI